MEARYGKDKVLMVMEFPHSEPVQKLLLKAFPEPAAGGSKRISSSAETAFTIVGATTLDGLFQTGVGRSHRRRWWRRSVRGRGTEISCRASAGAPRLCAGHRSSKPTRKKLSMRIVGLTL